MKSVANELNKLIQIDQLVPYIYCRFPEYNKNSKKKNSLKYSGIEINILTERFYHY